MQGTDSPIFIVGSERSGSNLLRLILNQHPSIAIPHPPHVMKEMMPLEPLYGDLGDDRRFRRLVGDVARLVERHFAPWDVRVDADAAFREAPARGVYGVKAAVYDQYRRAKGRPRWGCKSTFVIRWADRVLAVHPRAQFVHLVRDGRDVAVSARSSVFNRFHPHYVARLWAEEQGLALDLARRLPAESFMTLRYEDLLGDPARAVRGVCAFLREDYSDALLDYSGGEDAKALAAQNASWANVARPVMTENRARYKTELSAEEVRIFEREAADELGAFGYPLENDARELRAERARGVPAAARARYRLTETARAAFETLRSLARDRNGAALLRKRLFVARLRWSLSLFGP